MGKSTDFYYLTLDERKKNELRMKRQNELARFIRRAIPDKGERARILLSATEVCWSDRPPGWTWIINENRTAHLFINYNYAKEEAHYVLELKHREGRIRLPPRLQKMHSIDYELEVDFAYRENRYVYEGLLTGSPREPRSSCSVRQLRWGTWCKISANSITGQHHAFGDTKGFSEVQRRIPGILETTMRESASERTTAAIKAFFFSPK